MRIKPLLYSLECTFMDSVGLSTEIAHHLKVCYLRQFPLEMNNAGMMESSRCQN